MQWGFRDNNEDGEFRCKDSLVEELECYGRSKIYTSESIFLKQTRQDIPVTKASTMVAMTVAIMVELKADESVVLSVELKASVRVGKLVV